MTQRDLDEAVARLRAASLRNDPAAGDLAPDLGPPRGRPEAAGQGPLDPDIVDAHAHIVDGHEAPAAGGTVLPHSAFVQPLPRQGARAVPRENAAPAPVLDADDRRMMRQGEASPPDDYDRFVADEESGAGLRARLPAFLRRGGLGGRPVEEPQPADEARFAEGGAASIDDAAERAPRSLLRRRPKPASERPSPGRGRRRGRTDSGQTGRQGQLTQRELRWERRRKRRLFEEILGWILVPVILVGLYWAGIFGLSLLGLTLDDVVEGARQAWDALQ